MASETSSENVPEEVGYNGSIDSVSANPTTTSLQERKMAAKLKQLTDRNAARIQQSQSRKVDSHPSPCFASLDQFLSPFFDRKQTILLKLDGFLQNPPEISQRKSLLEGIGIDIGDLEKLVAQNSYFLPPYEVRSAQNAIAELREGLGKVTSQLIPKRKFAFKSKPSEKSSTLGPAKSASETDRAKSNDNTDCKDISPIEKKDYSSEKGKYSSPGFKNREGVTLIKDMGASEGGEFQLSDLVNCKIFLRGRLRALFVHGLKCCYVYAGPVMGSVLVEEVENSVLMLASHQIRIHQTTNTDFYLRVRSRPIVEYTRCVRFAPYAVSYRGIEEDLRECDLSEDTEMWSKVDDFRWLKAVASPNWCVLPEEDRLPPFDISDIKGGENGSD